MRFITRSSDVRRPDTSASAFSIVENIVNSFAGMTVALRLRAKCSTTPSCASAARATQSRSRSRLSSSGSPYIDSGTSAAMSHSDAATRCATGALAPVSPAGTRASEGARIALTRQ
jgi:hypothetical protein